MKVTQLYTLSFYTQIVTNSSIYLHLNKTYQQLKKQSKMFVINFWLQNFTGNFARKVYEREEGSIFL